MTYQWDLFLIIILLFIKVNHIKLKHTQILSGNFIFFQ